MRLFSLCFIFFISNAHAEGQNRFTVVLDAAHDLLNPGVQNPNGLEKDLTLSMVQKLEPIFKSEQPDWDVVLTRKGDYPLSLDERRRISNKNSNGVFITFHFSNIPNNLTPGIEIFLLSGIQAKDPGRFVRLEKAHLAQAPQSLSLATFLEESLKAKEKLVQIQVPHFLLSSLAGVQIPAIAIEFPSYDEISIPDFAQTLIQSIDRFNEQGNNP